MVSKLFVACAALLAMPGTAMAITIDGPAEVNESAGKATYTVTCGTGPNPAPLLPPIPYTGPVSISVEGAPAPAATGGEDYGDPTTTNVPVCNGSFTFDIPITDDGADENDENFTVTAQATPVLADPATAAFTTKIIDDDPIASIAPAVLVTEGDSGTQDAVLEVTLSSPPVETTTVKYATEALNATPGADYVEASGEVVFQPGETSKMIVLKVIGDTEFEPPEGFFVNLTDTDNGRLSPTARQGAVAIFDNDPRPVPVITIDRAVTVNEGDRGTVNVLFTVALSFEPVEAVAVSWKTVDWMADSSDYTPANGRLTFQPGQRTKTISVNVKGDTQDEPDEAFGVALENPAGATLGNPSSGFGIIADDDGPEVGIGKPKQRSKALVTKLACPASASRCRGTFRVKAGKRRIGKANLDMLKGTSTKVRTRLSRKVRNRLAKRPMRIKLIAVVTDAEGHTQKTVRKARLKRAR